MMSRCCGKEKPFPDSAFRGFFWPQDGRHSSSLYIVGGGGRASPYTFTKDHCGNMSRWWAAFLGSSAIPESSIPTGLMSTVADFLLNSSIRKINWGNLGWILKNLFGWAFFLQNENTSAADLCLPNSQVGRKEKISMFSFVLCCNFRFMWGAFIAARFLHQYWCWGVHGLCAEKQCNAARASWISFPRCF